MCRNSADRAASLDESGLHFGLTTYTCAIHSWHRECTSVLSRTTSFAELATSVCSQCCSRWGCEHNLALLILTVTVMEYAGFSSQ
jgi:hypothetical protein